MGTGTEEIAERRKLRVDVVVKNVIAASRRH